MSKDEEEEVRRVWPVLAELDLNSIAGEKKTGKEAWKRRVRQVSKGSGKEALEAIGMECDSDSLNGKRRFYLSDEATPDKENCLSEKKIKLGQLMDTEGTNMVEVANHKWPQLDQ